MIHRVDFGQWVPFPLQSVFLFFASPANLSRIMPPASNPRLGFVALVTLPAPPSWSGDTTGRAGTESVIVTSFRVLPPLPLRLQWVARISEFEWNHHFADVQQQGPCKSFHHRHEFAADTRNGVAGTRVGDRSADEVGFGPAGSIAQPLFLGRQLARTFHHRQSVLEGLLPQPKNRV
jgi:ligand-binding SRPBCC domain-containing protein